MIKKNSILSGLLLSLSLLGAGCSLSDLASTATPTPAIDGTGARSYQDISMSDPDNSNSSDQSQVLDIGNPQVLLFNGIGTSVSDWKNLELIMNSMAVTYRLINSNSLNAMSLSTLNSYKLILIPGGNSNYIISALTLSTKIRVRQAVRDGGVSFLGICAGAFAAVGIDSLSNTTAYYGFAVAQGDYIKHWYPSENTSLIAAVPLVTFADGTSRHLMWWDGPSTPEWSGGVVARYPGGKPAISQKWTGKGFVIVSGPHPEAPPSWQYDSGTDSDGTDYDIAKKLISAAMNRQPLPAY